MAAQALHYTAAISATSVRHSDRRFPLETLTPRKPILLVRCFSTSFPAKSARRKNHLRQKILKTLREPIIPKLPPANPIILTDSPGLQEIKESETIQDILEADKSENSEAGNEEVQKIEESGQLEVSVPAGVTVDGNIGILAKNPILKHGLWLVGAFVFQTVCSALVFGSVENTNEILNGTEKRSVIEVGGNGEGKSRVKFVLNGNGNEKFGVENSAVDSIVYVDELEMERKIEEIRVMAREAREKERLESKKNGLDSEDSEETNGEKHFKSEVEEEVDNRLIKLRKKLENARGKMPVSVGYLRENNERRDGVGEGKLDERESNGALLFKKKYKFKDLSGDPIEKPQGFIGLNVKRDKSGNRKKGDESFKSGNDGHDKISLGDGEKQMEPSDVDPIGSEAIHVVEEDKKKGLLEMRESTKNARKEVAEERATVEQGEGKGVARSKVIDGIALKKTNGKAVTSRKSSALDTAVASNELSKGNDILKGKGVGDAKLALKSESESNLWWLNLPYVLAILMQRGDDGKRREGLYTLKSISGAEERISHTVAFEDRADASNFCYLLQSFFEDLEDFQADVVPMTVKELIESGKSHAMRVIVVKRGQLKLYAGQPLTDAEMALHAMIKQN